MVNDGYYYVVGGFSPYPSEKWWSDSQLGLFHFPSVSGKS